MEKVDIVDNEFMFKLKDGSKYSVNSISIGFYKPEGQYFVWSWFVSPNLYNLKFRKKLLDLGEQLRKLKDFKFFQKG